MAFMESIALIFAINKNAQLIFKTPPIENQSGKLAMKSWFDWIGIAHHLQINLSKISTFYSVVASTPNNDILLFMYLRLCVLQGP